jgi:hypothetical protein
VTVPRISKTLGFTWRDARQIADVDAFFRGRRPAGPVALAPWTWQSLVGRNGALAFMSGCAVARESRNDRQNLEQLAALWPSTLFATHPASFRVVETSPVALPFPLPVDPDGYAHHAFTWRRRALFVANMPRRGRIFATARGPVVQPAVVLERVEKTPGPWRGFIDRCADAKLDVKGLKLALRRARRGPFSLTPAVQKRLVRGGMKRDVARALWGGEAILARDRVRELGMDLERVVALCDAAAGADAEALWDDPCAEGGPVDRMLEAWRATAALEASIDRLRRGRLGDLPGGDGRERRTAPTGKLGPACRAALMKYWSDPDDGAPPTPADLASEVQQIRYDRGMPAFERALAQLAKSVPARELGPALELIYQHGEHSH